jgi:hypothetical protein
MQAETQIDGRFLVEQFLSDIDSKADQLVASDAEATEAGITPYPGFGDDPDENAWEQLKPVMTEERRNAFLQRRKHEFQNQMRRRLITKWIKENTGIEDHYEVTALCTRIEILWRLDRREELTTYLCDVLRSGVKSANKESKRRQRGSWAQFVYVYVVIRGLVYVAAVVAILSVAETRFQKVALSVLIMIVNMLLTNRSSDALYRMRLGVVVDTQMGSLTRFFRFPEDDEERERRVEQMVDSEKDFAANSIATYIQFGFEILVWAICVVALVLALL